MNKKKVVVSFDNRIDKSLQIMMNELRSLGIKKVSRATALKSIIEMNDAARIKMYRKKRSKKLIFK